MAERQRLRIECHQRAVLQPFLRQRPLAQRNAQPAPRKIDGELG